MSIKDGGIIIIDFGSQTAQLIARRVREGGVFAALVPYTATLEQAQAAVPDFRGIILSGGPSSVTEPDAPQLPDWVLACELPVLGICYGMQLVTHNLGGAVDAAHKREFGPATLAVQRSDASIFDGIEKDQIVWMSHADHVMRPPDGFISLGSSEGAPYAAMCDPDRQIYAVQFHPEVTHTEYGKEILRNFVGQVCAAERRWNPVNFIDEAVAAVREKVGGGRVLLGLSGGVDSAVTGALLHRAVGDQLIPVFIDHGMMRQDEPQQVVQAFEHSMGLNLRAVYAGEEFISALENITDPEEKRHIIGRLFVETFEAQAEKVGSLDWLAQGTIYPDVIESAGTGRPGAKRIKSHHNVGGLPERMKDKLVEPLRDLFKDEVREVGTALGLPDEIVWRQPFPGPGLAVRCLGQITFERLETLRQADAIFTHELAMAGLLRSGTSQAFAVLLPVQSVGVMGDNRTYDEVIALRAVTTDDFMTADWARLPYDLLARVSNRIVNEVQGVNRVVYDVSSKPPATIEWE